MWREKFGKMNRSIKINRYFLVQFVPFVRTFRQEIYIFLNTCKINSLRGEGGGEWAQRGEGWREAGRRGGKKREEEGGDRGREGVPAFKITTLRAGKSFVIVSTSFMRSAGEETSFTL